MAHYRGEGLRPSIVVGECDHRIFRQQQEGISLQEAWEMVHHYDKK
jgi:hypothetical protein